MQMTEQARKVMVLANEEALRRNHEYVGTEHLLLGLIAERNGVAAQVLKNLHIDLIRTRRAIDKIIIPGSEAPLLRRLPMTPRAKKVLEYAAEEALVLGCELVGPEHVLLGILREQEGLAAQVLMNLGLRLAVVRQELLATLGVTADSVSDDAETAHLPEPARRIVAEFDRQIHHLQQRQDEAVAVHESAAARGHQELREMLRKLRSRFIGEWHAE